MNVYNTEKILLIVHRLKNFHICMNVLLFFYFRWKKDKARQRYIFHLLVHFSDIHMSWGWARLNLGSVSRFGFPSSRRDPRHLSHLPVPPRASIHRELDLKPGTVNRKCECLTCCARHMLSTFIYFIRPYYKHDILTAARFWFEKNIYLRTWFTKCIQQPGD